MHSSDPVCDTRMTLNEPRPSIIQVYSLCMQTMSGALKNELVTSLDIMHQWTEQDNKVGYLNVSANQQSKKF